MALINMRDLAGNQQPQPKKDTRIGALQRASYSYRNNQYFTLKHFAPARSKIQIPRSGTTYGTVHPICRSAKNPATESIVSNPRLSARSRESSDHRVSDTHLPDPAGTQNQSPASLKHRPPRKPGPPMHPDLHSIYTQ
jgi:hypothetical protein